MEEIEVFLLAEEEFFPVYTSDLAAGADVPVLAGEHVGFHQLVVRQMRPLDGSDAVFKAHDAVLPWPCGASG